MRVGNGQDEEFEAVLAEFEASTKEMMGMGIMKLSRTSRGEQRVWTWIGCTAMYRHQVQIVVASSLSLPFSTGQALFPAVTLVSLAHPCLARRYRRSYELFFFPFGEQDLKKG